MRARIHTSRSERRHAARRRGRSAPAEPCQVPPRTADACSDPAVARVRDSGGPLDAACYSCQCGYVFVARVSTSVTCPHCNTGQAW
jgi:hypothetical protein